MKTEQVVKAQQQEVNKRLKNKPSKKRRRGKESLSFSKFGNMMKHDIYARRGIRINNIAQYEK